MTTERCSILARRPLAALCALAVLLSPVGCAFSRYLYISLEGQPGVEVEAYTTPNLEHLYSSSQMPTKYLVEREGYRLSFTTIMDSYLPEIRLAVYGADGEQLRIAQKAARKARGDRAVPCGSFGSMDGSGSNELRFSWVTCKDAGIDEAFISFDVASESGEILGKEDIPFELKANGFYVLPDLL